MRVPDDMLSTVAFLCVESSPGRYQYGGTGFFLAIDSETHKPDYHQYFVTARHVVTRALNRHGKLFVRMNTRAGGAYAVEMAPDLFEFPEDPCIDVAVAPFSPPNNVFDYVTLHSDFILTPDAAAQHGVGIGDELLVVGLFTARHGREQNQPIVRAGIISAMPGEPLMDDELGCEFRAYLAEIHSIGGLSGSPVFGILPPGRVHPTSKTVDLSRTFFLLGLIRGHWDYKTAGPIEFVGDEDKHVKMGMATVTPMRDVWDFLHTAPYVEGRREGDKLRQTEQPEKRTRPDLKMRSHNQLRRELTGGVFGQRDKLPKNSGGSPACYAKPAKPPPS